MSILVKEQVCNFTKAEFNRMQMRWFERKVEKSPVFWRGLTFGIVGLITLDNYLHSKGLINAAAWGIISKIRYGFLWIGFALMLFNTSRIIINAYRSHKDGRCFKECLLVACFKFFTPSLANDMEEVLIKKKIPQSMIKLMEKGT